MKLSRRDLFKLGLAGTAALFIEARARFLTSAQAAVAPQMPLAASAIPQFVDPVPNLLDPDEQLIIDDGKTPIELEMREHMTRILPAGAVPNYQGTYVWSYLKSGQTKRTSYLGPVVLATRGQPTEMKFVNLLGNSQSTNVLAYKYSTDQTLHWADPLNDGMNMFNHMNMAPAFGSDAAQNYDGPIPAVVHLHGGEVPPELDGGPDAWMTSDGSRHGAGFYTRDGSSDNYHVYRYPNSQEGALIWFHDHTLGATRLNVYAGLAGAYLIVDPKDTLFAQLPELFPLVIQDRMFDTNGQLFFPAASSGGVQWAPNPEHPYWVPEFVGDVIVVNGKSWPYMNVAPKRYTFQLINGSNARSYELALVDPVSKNPGPALWVIGTDGGYLDKPVKIDPAAAANNVLPMMSGERYWVIVDFKGYEAGKIGPNKAAYSGNWLLKNNAKTPYPAGAAPQGATTGRVMQFRVTGGPVSDTSYNPASGEALRAAMPRLSGAPLRKIRQMTLNEVMGMPVTTQDPVTGNQVAFPGGPLEILVNNTKWDGQRAELQWDPVTLQNKIVRLPIPGFTPDASGMNYISETPQEGETELWEIVNLTADAHPIHLHLVQFQLLNRQAYNTSKYTKAYAAAFPGGGVDPMTGQPYPPATYIPSYGPPLDYAAGNSRALGGNPDITPYLQGPARPPQAHEAGWKDTVIMLPGEVTRILVRWAPTDLPANTPPVKASYPFDPSGIDLTSKKSKFGYVWHCHIVDHEDNEMMRPDMVTANSGAVRTYVKGVDY